METFARYYLKFSAVMLILLIFTLLGLYTYITYEMTLTLFSEQSWLQWVILGFNIFSIMIGIRLVILWLKERKQGTRALFRKARQLFTMQFCIHVAMLFVFFLFADMDDAPGLILVGAVLPFALSNGIVYTWLKEKSIN